MIHEKIVGLHRKLWRTSNCAAFNDHFKKPGNLKGMFGKIPLSLHKYDAFGGEVSPFHASDQRYLQKGFARKSCGLFIQTS